MITELLSRRESRSSIEDPNTPLTSSRILEFFQSGSKSHSGVKVNERAAISNPAIWRGVNLVSLTVSNLPLKVYRRMRQGGKEEDRAHPAWSLLHNRFSAGILSCHGLQLTTAKAMLRGNGYAWIIRNNAGEPVELLPLSTADTVPGRIKDTNRVVYLTRLAEDEGIPAKTFTLREDDVLHIKGLHLDPTGLRGLSIVEALTDAIGLGLAAQKYGSIFFKNNARPSMVIEVPYRFSSQEQVEEFRQRWGDVHGGLEQSHRPAILESGAKVSPLSVNNEDAQWLQLREFEIRQVANMLHVPASKLQDNARTAYNSLEQDNKSFLEESLRPWLNQWEKECRKKLLRIDEQEQNSHTIEFELESLLRTDKKTEIELLINQVNNGILTLNQALNILNLPAVDGGDDRRVPTNVMVAGDVAAEAPLEADEDEDDEDDVLSSRLLDIQREYLVEQSRRFLRRLGYHARNASKKPMQFRTWCQTFVDKEGGIFVESITPTVRTIQLLTSGSTNNPADILVTRTLTEIQKELLGISSRGTKETLQALVDETMVNYEAGSRAVQLAEAICK